MLRGSLFLTRGTKEFTRREIRLSGHKINRRDFHQANPD